MVPREENMLRPVAHLPGCYNQQQDFVCLLRKQNKHKKALMTLILVAGLSLKAREQEFPVARIRMIPPPQLLSWKQEENPIKRTS